MKAKAVRAAASSYTSEQLAEAVEAITEHENELLDIEGEDMGERLTHLLLALRIRARMDGGEELKTAFRAEMHAVRETLKND